MIRRTPALKHLLLATGETLSIPLLSESALYNMYLSSHIDSAQAYRNEAHVGEAVREAGIPREQIFVSAWGCLMQHTNVIC